MTMRQWPGLAVFGYAIKLTTLEQFDRYHDINHRYSLRLGPPPLSKNHFVVP